MRSQRIMLWGWFGFENLGDDLLLQTMLSHLDYEKRTITIPMKNRYKIDNIHINQIDRSYKNLLQGALSNDTIVIGPGGLFPFDNKIKVILYYIIVKIWKLFNRKVIFFGIGVSEKMSEFSAMLWRKIAKTSDLFITRSSDILDRLGLQETKRIHSMADTVFASHLTFKSKSQRNTVAIVVANLEQDEKSKSYNQAVITWTQVIEKLLDTGYQVDLLAFKKETDDCMVNSIISAIGSRGGVYPIYYKEVFNSIGNWKKYSFVVSMRFHSLVLSILADVPVVPIAYGHKTFSLAQKCDLVDFTLIWNSFQKKYYGENLEVSDFQIIEKIDLLCSNIETVKKRIHEKRSEFVISSKSAIEQLNNILDG